MTEQEARTKWCPKANIAAVGSFGFNRDTTGDPASKSFCVASDCMKWPECKYWWERPTIEQIKADYDEQARKTAQIIVKEFEAKHGGTP